MPATCSAWGCEHRRGKDGKALFKWVPAVSKTCQRAEWIKNVKRAGNLPQVKNFPMCWQHFTTDCFELDFYAENKSGKSDKIYKIKTTPCQQFSNSRRKRPLE